MHERAGSGVVALDLGEVVTDDRAVAHARTGRFTRTRWPRPTRHSVSCVIPAMNEAQNIEWVLERLPEYIDEVILVDGDSKDATVAVSRAVRPDIVVVTQDRPGKGAALRAGFAAATCDLIVMLDADRSMDPQEINRFLALLEEGYDLVKGSRFMEGGGTDDMSRVRRLGNAALRSVLNTAYRGDFSDLCYGYIAFHRRVLGDLDLKADGFEIETEIIVRAMLSDLRIGEVPSFELSRAHGESNLRTWRDGRRVLNTLVSHRFTRAPRRAEAAPALTALEPSPSQIEA